jgi:hypothetical protein
MRKNVLMPDNEPTDEELSQIMKEVAEDAKEKARITHLKHIEKHKLTIEEKVKEYESK